MLTGLIVGLVVGVVGVISLALRQNKESKRIKHDLAVRGIPIAPGGGALQVAPTWLIGGGNKPPLWSAAIPGMPVLQLYGVGSTMVVTWRSVAQRPGAFVLSTSGSNPDARIFHQIPKKELPVRGAQVFVTGPDVAHWIYSSGVLNLFVQRFSVAQQGWTLACFDSVCYAFSYQGQWQGLDDVLRTASGFEAALGRQ